MKKPCSVSWCVALVSADRKLCAVHAKRGDEFRVLADDAPDPTACETCKGSAECQTCLGRGDHLCNCGDEHDCCECNGSGDCEECQGSGYKDRTKEQITDAEFMRWNMMTYRPPNIADLIESPWDATFAPPGPPEEAC